MYQKKLKLCQWLTSVSSVYPFQTCHSASRLALNKHTGWECHLYTVYFVFRNEALCFKLVWNMFSCVSYLQWQQSTDLGGQASCRGALSLPAGSTLKLCVQTGCSPLNFSSVYNNWFYFLLCSFLVLLENINVHNSDCAILYTINSFFFG